MSLTMNQAAKECGRAKSTLSKAIKTGKLSAEKQTDGSYLIDPAELFRVFPQKQHGDQIIPERNTTREPANTDLAMEIGRLRSELEAERRITASMEQTVADLRDRLDKESEERRKLTAMLTDQRVEQGSSRRFFGLFPAKTT